MIPSLIETGEEGFLNILSEKEKMVITHIENARNEDFVNFSPFFSVFKKLNNNNNNNNNKTFYHLIYNFLVACKMLLTLSQTSPGFYVSVIQVF